MHLNVYAGVYVSLSVFMYVHSCMFACMCVWVCVFSMLIDRVEDHCGCSDPVCEEAVGCDDPDCLLSQRLCSDWAAALYGEPAAEVCNLANQHDRAVAGKWHQGL